jgi:putative chitinase
MKLSEHFTLEELTFSQTAVRSGINNNPSQVVKNNLKILADNLEKIRTFLGHPLRISSAFRCMELNRKIGGSVDSAHMNGLAADFTCSGFGKPIDIVKALQKSNIKLDQVIYEGTWVHVSFDPKMRQQFLTATFINGKPSYKPFKE